MISSPLLVLLTFVTGCGDDRVSDLPIEELLWGTWEYRPSNDTFKDLGVGEGQHLEDLYLQVGWDVFMHMDCQTGRDRTLSVVGDKKPTVRALRW